MGADRNGPRKAPGGGAFYELVEETDFEASGAETREEVRGLTVGLEPRPSNFERFRQTAKLCLRRGEMNREVPIATHLPQLTIFPYAGPLG
jgi:hypothetical protein